MKKFHFSVRILTVAPIVALATFTILHFASPDLVGGGLNYFLALLFITLLPLLAYPLQPLIPYFREKRRKGQRYLAIIMSVIGYIGGVVCAFALDMPDQMKMIFLTYLLSGLLILLFSKATSIKASGHACGVAGPIAFLTYVYGPIALLGFPLLSLVFWSSRAMKRHRVLELVVGSIIPVVSLFVSILFIYII